MPSDTCHHIANMEYSYEVATKGNQISMGEQQMRKKEKEQEEEIYLYSKDQNKLSWKETYQAMASENEDWSDLDTMVADGLD